MKSHWLTTLGRGMIWGTIAFFALLTARAQSGFTAITRPTNGWVRLQGQVQPERIVVLQASPNLMDWDTIALLDQRVLNPFTWSIEYAQPAFDFLDPETPGLSQRFYRYATFAPGETNDWKNQIRFPNDILVATQADANNEQIRWVKFAIVLDQPHRIFYQDSQKYLLHHDFAKERLQPFAGLDRALFDQVSLYHTNQQVLLGTVLIAPKDDIVEYGIQFTGRDPYPREKIVRFFELVRSTIVAPPGTVSFYFPAYEQSDVVALDETFLAEHGIRLGSPHRWIQGDQIYAAGWALGRLRFISAREINAAYADGRLTPVDILVTDGIPAEVPFVAGIISTAPATPNSHVAILAGTYGVPFAYVASPTMKTLLSELNGQEVIFQASLQSGAAVLSLFKVADTLDPKLRSDLLTLKQPVNPVIRPKEKYGAWSASTDQLKLDDIRFFGGKAAQYGILRRAIPEHCPPAIAFSFDLWDAFMDQTLLGGTSLRAEIQTRLAGYVYPPDMQSVATNLAAIRALITKTAQFSPTQKEAITNALVSFEPQRNIRFRSSSNAEDNLTFNAAGLFDSYSGCLADDLDDDTVGPSHGDPTEPNERGVFRAMQKVYASFYNDNAFLERLRHGMDESRVGMALLMHYSTPDDQELANGVATVSMRQQAFGRPELVAKLVTQAGAVSVTNPEGNARPEIVECNEQGGLSLYQSSSLVPLGSQVLQWESEYQTLGEWLFKVYQQYRSEFQNNVVELVLDCEYKKVKLNQLIIKQVRPLVSPDSFKNPQRFLLNEPTRYWVFQREGSDVFANHRLKGFLTLETRDLAADSNNLSQCFYTKAHLEWRDGTNVQTLTGAMSTWPSANHTVSLDPQRRWTIQDQWSAETGTQHRQFQLTSIFPSASSTAAPFVRQADIRKRLRVTYDVPVPTLDWREQGTNTLQEEIQLIACPDLDSLQAGPAETFTNSTGISVTISFLTSTNNTGPMLGVDPNAWGTFPAYYSPWMHTRITGLTSEPLELRGYYSQSAAAGHKYRYAWYIFEPGLEPDLPQKQVDELTAANIQLIHIAREVWPGGQVTITLLGRDDQWKKL